MTDSNCWLTTPHIFPKQNETKAKREKKMRLRTVILNWIFNYCFLFFFLFFKINTQREIEVLGPEVTKFCHRYFCNRAKIFHILFFMLRCKILDFSTDLHIHQPIWEYFQVCDFECKDFWILGGTGAFERMNILKYFTYSISSIPPALEAVLCDNIL